MEDKIAKKQAREAEKDKQVQYELAKHSRFMLSKDQMSCSCGYDGPMALSYAGAGWAKPLATPWGYLFYALVIGAYFYFHRNDADAHFMRVMIRFLAPPFAGVVILYATRRYECPNCGKEHFALGNAAWHPRPTWRAETLLKRSVTDLEQQPNPDQSDLAKSLDNLALFYVTQGKYWRAEPLYERSLNIVETARGPDHPTVATQLCNLAKLYRAQRLYAKAEPFFLRALKIIEQSQEELHLDVAICLTDIAGLHRAQGRYAVATPFDERALLVRRKTLASDHHLVKQSVENVARDYRGAGRIEEALELERQIASHVVA